MLKLFLRAGPLLASVIVLVGCSSATSASASPSAGTSLPLTLPTAAVPTASVALPSATATPTLTPLPTAEPSPSAAVAGWSVPVRIRNGSCWGLTAAIDPSGRYHVAAVCDNAIHYLTSPDGTDWAETAFVPPVGRLEQDPQLTLDGDTVSMAYSLIAPTDGGCGDDGLQDVGVYTRSIRPPDGSWSTPVKVGATGDRVQSYRVVDGTVFLTVTAKDGAGPLYYETQSGTDLSRIAIPGAVTTSLRVGDDGRARIAYATGHAIHYARVDGGQLSGTTVAASDKTFLKSPSLVLGPGDHAYMVWNQNVDNGGGCVSLEPGPLDGIYFGTDASGSWKTARLTKQPGVAALTLDPSSGRIDVVIGLGPGLSVSTSVGGARWTSTPLPGTTGLSDPVIRHDPLTGGTSVFASDYDTGIFLVTGP